MIREGSVSLVEIEWDDPTWREIADQDASPRRSVIFGQLDLDPERPSSG
jgi:hypothetical protein